ncbi:MAG: hypothetical protein IPM79_05230 [Polyangiaceae bacterium]|nr:hypothetical protein [Polyangiaceae bacterium]
MRQPLRLVAPLAALALGAGCDVDTDSEPDPEPSSTIQPLTPEQHLVRASMALRGTRPSRADLERVADDPEALEGVVDGYLESDEFGRTVRDLHNETLLLRPDWLYYPAGFQPLGALADRDLVSINASVMEAPLRLVERVVMEDRPYGEIVTADYVMVDPITSVVWDLPYEAGGAEWQAAKHLDGRGNAGVLTDSWLYVRYQSTPSNANRQRANAVSRALLCYDFLDRDVELDTNVDVADPNAVQDAVVANAACASCHQALDPLASFFKDVFPLIVPQDTTEYPMQSMWLPGVFEELLQIDMREPSYFGQPGETLEDLGALIADDPRFSLCAAKRFYAYFNQVDVHAVPLERAAELQEVLVDSGMSAKALAKAVILSDDFRASHGADLEEAEDIVGLRKARPDELASLMHDLTGFQWLTDLSELSGGTIREVELPRDTMLGYRVIGGGIDSAFVTRNTFTDSAGTSLFLRAFAEEASAFVVARDLGIADPSARRLLTLVDGSDTGEDAVRDQIVELYARVFGELVEADDEQVGESYALFAGALDASGDTSRAWQTLLTAMFQDVRVAYY